MAHYMPQLGTEGMVLDKKRNTTFLMRVLAHPAVSHIYLEPQLVQRWALPRAKVGLTGCAAVRHDDHVHVRVD